MGALKLAATPEIFITTPEEADQIISYNKSAECRIRGEQNLGSLFYFRSSPLDPEQVEDDWEEFFAQAFQTRIDDTLRKETLDRDYGRVFILIERSTSPPSNAYVAISRRGYWYSIRLDDETSKNNFALLNEILTIQAVPERTPELTPTLPVSH